MSMSVLVSLAFYVYLHFLFHVLFLKLDQYFRTLEFLQIGNRYQEYCRSYPYFKGVLLLFLILVKKVLGAVLIVYCIPIFNFIEPMNGPSFILYDVEEFSSICYSLQYQSYIAQGLEPMMSILRFWSVDEMVVDALGSTMHSCEYSWTSIYWPGVFFLCTLIFVVCFSFGLKYYLFFLWFDETLFHVFLHEPKTYE